MGPLASPSLHQPYPEQGSGYDWLLSPPARDKRCKKKTTIFALRRCACLKIPCNLARHGGSEITRDCKPVLSTLELKGDRPVERFRRIPSFSRPSLLQEAVRGALKCSRLALAEEEQGDHPSGCTTRWVSSTLCCGQQASLQTFCLSPPLLSPSLRLQQILLA